MPFKSLLLCILLPAVFSAGTGPASAGELPVDLRQRLTAIQGYKTLQAAVEQTIIQTGTKTENYTGYYRADQNGHIRVDYYEPDKQRVYYNGSRLWWVYPEQALAWRLGGSKSRQMLPVVGRPVKLDDFNLDYDGRTFYDWGFHHRLIMRPRQKMKGGHGPGGYIELLLHADRLYILRRSHFDHNDRLLFEEVFSDYINVGGHFIPRSVEVTLSRNGVRLVNRTRYSQVVINRPLPASLFEFSAPAGYTVKDYESP